jgi:hypothetical protein
VNWGEKGVKEIKVKGRDSCYQTGDQGEWEFVTTSKKPALQVSKAGILFMKGASVRDCLYIV